MKKYIELTAPTRNATHIVIETYYNLGGYNPFTGKSEERGYYLSVSPAELKNGMESYTAFSGLKQLVKPVHRKSEKAAEQAADLALQYYISDLVKTVCNRNGIQAPQVLFMTNFPEV